MEGVNIWFWVAFNAFVLVMLALDLGVFHRESHKVSVREAAVWSTVWISLALLFNVGLYFYAGRTVALEFLGGYLLEKSLSVDNIFVFVLIFSYFNVPAIYQHRVLFWGILTALVLRGAMILIGAALISRFEFLITIFGAFLLFTGIRMAFEDERHIDAEANPVLGLLRRFMPVTNEYHGEKFTIVEAGQRVATPLLVVLLLVETTDVIFAVDSIPAIFGITQDPFIVYTSNIFAILGLRALYFLLAGVIEKFHYLQLGLAVVLSFVGVKMLVESLSPLFLEHGLHVPIEWSLGFIGVVLGTSVVVSLLFPKAAEEHAPTTEHPTEIPVDAQPPADALDV
ncbi:MAG: TerC family protein [Chloroflexota bacterium]|nr:TerC family protein [Chloroflexota bacterium]